MKIVDLLVKIANKEEVPYKIKYNGNIYEFDEETQNYLRHVNLGMDFLIEEDIVCLLNDEVEIIEEKKILEKLNLDTYAAIGTEVDKDVIIKINEIIDKVNSLKNKQ